MVPCECYPDCTSSGQYATDRHGRNWCKWCHGNGICNGVDGHHPHPYQSHNKTSEHTMTTKFPCPECGDHENMHLLEHMEAAAITTDGFAINKGKVYFDCIGEIQPLENQDTVGVVCMSCGWAYKGDDWQDHIANFEVREQERIQREFRREAGLLTEEEAEADERLNASRTWEVPLVHGKVQIIVPINDSNHPDATPITLTVDMNEIDEPQDIHIDPKARTVSLKTKEPWVEVCDECEAEIPEDANRHAGDWHKPFCSLFIDNVMDGFESDEVELHKTSYPGPRGRETMRQGGAAQTFIGDDAPEIMGTRRAYVYVTDKDNDRRLSQSLLAKSIAQTLGAVRWDSDDIYDGMLAVGFDVPNNISDDEIRVAFADQGLTAEIDNE